MKTSIGIDLGLCELIYMVIMALLHAINAAVLFIIRLLPLPSTVRKYIIVVVAIAPTNLFWLIGVKSRMNDVMVRPHRAHP